MNSFYEIYDAYRQQVINQCKLPNIEVQEVVANKVDTSTLSADDQRGFNDWLAERCYVQMSVGNALRRDLRVEALLANKTACGKVAYSVRIEGL